MPFPVESQLSGLERHEDHMFYRKLVDVPKNWKVGKSGTANRLKLNFGAVDYQATVYVNGRKVAEHTGGYNAFTADITDALKSKGKQEIVVAVTDTGGADQPTGKQSTHPGGIFYTQSSGIWQTVWMEPVAHAAIDNVVTTPDIDTGTLAVTVESENASRHARVEAVARDARGKVVGRVSGPAGSKLDLRVAGQRLWSPDDPYLYDLDIKLKDGRSTDEVGSYFGMREIGIKEVGGFQKLVLNGKPVFSSPPSTRASGPTASTPRPATTPWRSTSKRTRSSASTPSASTSRWSHRAGSTTRTDSACWSGRTSSPGTSPTRPGRRPSSTRAGR
ncbi:hypothetical protein SHKM778_50880 [Streptomyces sp. KM77-8]|uniref:Glycosyl hydrolases family 2 sugar binding domain-containing protein n=1 Tax=Streptomyces haneummycinicus TaxID=3074435 RepID=A0AAT9HMN9_9ACTN